MTAPPVDKDQGMPRIETAPAAPVRSRSGGRYYWIGLLALATIGTYFATGFYVVNADEHAVVRRFGAIAARVGPGMHYRLPWPVDRVDVLKTTSVMKVGVGFALPENDSQAMTGVEVLTGDTNILSVALAVQYVIVTRPTSCFRSSSPRSWWERWRKAC